MKNGRGYLLHNNKPKYILYLVLIQQIHCISYGFYKIKLLRNFKILRNEYLTHFSLANNFKFKLKKSLPLKSESFLQNVLSSLFHMNKKLNPKHLYKFFFIARSNIKRK